MFSRRHVHAYERHNRVFNYTLDACAPYYVTIGMPLVLLYCSWQCPAHSAIKLCP